MVFRNYFAWTVFFVLLIWGPIDKSLTWWQALRIVYAIIIPIAIWLLLGWIWKSLEPSDKTENGMNRILSGIICIILFVNAYLAATSKNHLENTQLIRTRDGMEAVGDDIIVQGPDYSTALFIIIIAGLLLWYGVIKPKQKSETH